MGAQVVPEQTTSTPLIITESPKELSGERKPENNVKFSVSYEWFIATAFVAIVMFFIGLYFLISNIYNTIKDKLMLRQITRNQNKM